MSQPEDDFVVVFCTAPPGEADALAKTIVEEQLAACVNISPVRSCYIIALPIVAGHQPCLDWLSGSD